MDQASFVDRYGGVFENSPWIVEQAWEQGRRDGSVQELSEAFATVIRNADREQQQSLLRAHPQLACGMAPGEDLTDHSRKEQRGAGLDRCSPAEFEEFKRLNSSYTDKFGFPFIIAVRGLGRRKILEMFRARLDESPGSEFREALEQVIRIGEFRLREIIASRGVDDDD